VNRQDELRQQALKTLQEFEVVQRGHFDYGNGFHGRLYLNPHQLFRYPSTIWRLAQDLIDGLPSELLQRTDVVAGPATGGALLAHTLAGLLDGRRALTHPSCSFAPFTNSEAGFLLRAFYARQMLERSGSIEGFFVEGLAAGAVDIGPALDSFSTRAQALDMRRAYGRLPKRPGVCYFFPRPSAGSACKRLNLFLRWMVRRDEVDLGVWSRVSPAQLIVPLDTHVIRVGRCLRLTRYTSAGWRMAADITASLRRLDATDPIRFDFSICHVGMMNACGFHKPQGDTPCPLNGLCHPRLRRRSA
jgi:uncharacterized protein (TIGR02757 family)